MSRNAKLGAAVGAALVLAIVVWPPGATIPEPPPLPPHAASSPPTARQKNLSFL